MKKTDAELAAPNFQHPQPQGSQPAHDQIDGVQPNIQDLLVQINLLRREIDMLKSKRINANTDIIGLFETVTAAPTLTPRSFLEQIKLANIAGTYYIYAYNTSSKTWRSVAIT